MPKRADPIPASPFADAMLDATGPRIAISVRMLNQLADTVVGALRQSVFSLCWAQMATRSRYVPTSLLMGTTVFIRSPV